MYIIEKVICMLAKYDAIKLSEKVINIAYENHFFICNLQLQKVMYYIQGTFMKCFHKKAFYDDIECWPYGPVVKRVWSKYNVYGRRPIRNVHSSLKITEEEYRLISGILNKKLSKNIWDLVDETHSEFPWLNANKNGRNVISDKDMETFFVNEKA